MSETERTDQKQYGVIVADPPWPNSPTGFTMKGGIPTFSGWWSEDDFMSIEDLCGLQVPASKDALLFLWTTSRELVNALEAMKAWGFQYKTSLVWAKTKNDGTLKAGGGIGYWAAMQHELVLLGTKGRPPRPGKKAMMPSIIGAPVLGGAGVKPESLFTRIEQSGAVGPYLEMFARRRRPGWDAFGRVEGSIGIDGNTKTGVQ